MRGQGESVKRTLRVDYDGQLRTASSTTLALSVSRLVAMNLHPLPRTPPTRQQKKPLRQASLSLQQSATTRSGRLSRRPVHLQLLQSAVWMTGTMFIWKHARCIIPRSGQHLTDTANPKSSRRQSGWLVQFCRAPTSTTNPKRFLR